MEKDAVLQGLREKKQVVTDAFDKLKRLANGEFTFLFDYVERVKDESFEEQPMNLIDALIFSNISYYRFDFMEYPENKVLTIEEAENIYDLNPDLKLTAIYNECRNPFLSLLAKTKRYKNLKLFKYKRDYSAVAEKQFAAIAIELNENTVFISFSGTDSTLTGIREDMNMAYMKRIPSQTIAKNYINKECFKKYQNIYIGGHSKGGNLAVYAGMKFDHEHAYKIRNIFNFDGPGFTQERLKDPKNNQIEDKIITVVPEMSIFGMIWNNPKDLIVIDSSNFSVFQHDPFSWKIDENNHFVFKNYVSKSSAAFSNSVDEYMNKLSSKQRGEFVDLLWYFANATSAYTLADLKKNIVKNTFRAISMYIQLKPESRKIINHNLRIIIKCINDSVKALERPESQMNLFMVKKYDEFKI